MHPLRAHADPLGHAFHVLVALCLGLATTFAAAWAPCLWCPLGPAAVAPGMFRCVTPGTAEVALANVSDEAWARPLADRAVRENWPGARHTPGFAILVAIESRRTYGLDWWTWTEESNSPTRHTLRAGLPFRAFTSAATQRRAMVRPTVMPPPLPRTRTALGTPTRGVLPPLVLAPPAWSHALTPSPRLRPQSDWPGNPRILPFAPLWGGLAADTALFGSAWFALLLIPRAMYRRLILYRRGRCPRCAYDLTGLPPNAPCPECGKPRS